jgi:hypothetical protein
MDEYPTEIVFEAAVLAAINVMNGDFPTRIGEILG